MVDADAVEVVVDGTVLLEPTSVSLRPGSALMVRGHNGAGKSTFLQVLSGLRRPTSGTVLVAGEPVSTRHRSFRRRVSAMIGLPPMAPDLTVRDHVELVAATWSDDGPRPRTVAEDLLDGFGIAALALRFPHELSTGQVQLAGLSMVLARPFEVLLLDEPEQRLDPQHLDLVADALIARRDRGATLVVATHSPVLAARVGDEERILTAAR